MNTEQLLDEIAQMHYPREVDVVDAVMAEVRQHPYLVPKHRNVILRRVALTAAAVAAVAIIAVPALLHRTYDEQGIGDMMASVQNYDYYSHVESLAENPIAYLYDEPDFMNE